MSIADIIVLFTGIGSMIGVMLVHEVRAMHREATRQNHHAEIKSALDDNRRLTLAAIDQRNRLEERMIAIEASHREHAAWISNHLIDHHN